LDIKTNLDAIALNWRDTVRAYEDDDLESDCSKRSDATTDDTTAAEVAQLYIRQARWRMQCSESNATSSMILAAYKLQKWFRECRMSDPAAVLGLT